ncbi:MAG: endo-1,4-beta-xylanase [Treponema sp.]|nr:endo-1,4-beta-xylanase [Treponema sp.]
MKKPSVSKQLAVFTVLWLLLPGSLMALGTKDRANTQSKPQEPPIKETVVFEDNFEQALQGWTGRASEVINLVENKASDGKKALSISGRTSTWNGPIRDITAILKAGNSYKIGLWVLYEEGTEKLDFTLSLERTIGTSKDYLNLGGGTVPRGDWTFLESTYTVPVTKNPAQYRLYVETKYKQDDQATKDDLTPFYIDGVKIVQLPPPKPAQAETDIPAFYTFFKNLPIGAAITSADLDASRLHNRLLRHFNAFVYENEMKQDAIQPTEGRFVFDKADALIAFVQKQNARVRGHTLVWHNQYPKWFFQDPQDPTAQVSKELLLSRIETHIRTVVGRYKGKVYAWDVVNEVVDESGALRNSPYLKIVGSDEYIAKAFRWAREADPKAQLFINDYNIEFKGPKQDGLFNLVKKLKEEGIPIDGVGLQAHISIGFPTVNDMRNAIRRFASLGVKVHITELDMSIYSSGSEPKKEADRETLLAQADKYRELFTMFQEEAVAGNLDMVMLWGLSDDRTWLNNFPTPGRGDYPLLFGKDLRAKSAYWAIVDPTKLPIGIKNGYAYKLETIDLSNRMWNYLMNIPIQDQKGNTFGSYKVAWNNNTLAVLVTVQDDTADKQDSVTVYVEPKNRRQEKRSDDLVSISLPRTKATADNGKEYTVQMAFPFYAKAETKAGFDIVITDGSSKGKLVQSWNDYTNSQENSTINFGTLTFKVLPRTLDVKKGTVTIGRARDPLWDSAEPIPMNVKTVGVTEDGSEFRLLWDEEYLYVLIDVKDNLLNDKNSNPWEQDSVEVFIDQNNGKTSSYEADDAQYRVNFRNQKSYNGGDELRFQSATRVVLGGYWVAMAVPLTHIKATAGSLLGFDVQINEADASGNRLGIRNWHNDTNMGYKDPSGFGIIRLVE